MTRVEGENTRLIPIRVLNRNFKKRNLPTPIEMINLKITLLKAI